MVSTKIIALEALDAAGKTTLAHNLSKYFFQNNISYRYINSLSSDDLSPLIRQKLKQKEVTKRELAGLFISELHSHARTIAGIIELEPVEFILLDRWIYSTAAYNAENHTDIEHILKLSASTYIDHIIYLDITPSVAVERLKSRDELDVYENLSELERVYDNYNYINNLTNFKIIDATLTPDEVLDAALNIIGLK